MRVPEQPSLLDELAYLRMKATLEQRDSLLEPGELTAVMDQLFGRLAGSPEEHARLQRLGAERAYLRIRAGG